MAQNLSLSMRIIQAREDVHAALLALPRSISWADVASAAGVSDNTITRFIHTPERCKSDTVAAIAEAIQKLRGEAQSND